LKCRKIIVTGNEVAVTVPERDRDMTVK
jgi:hypothetical protein